jgi:glucose-1-phosphate thymidylyltransferase
MWPCTHQSLLEAASFVKAIEARQGLKIACLEEIAWTNGWITPEQVKAEATSMGKSAYAAYLWDLLKQAGHG